MRRSPEEPKPEQPKGHQAERRGAGEPRPANAVEALSEAEGKQVCEVRVLEAFRDVRI